MTREMFMLATLLLAANAFADDDDAIRAKLAGAWLVDNEVSTKTVWILQEKSDAIRITHSEGSKKLATMPTAAAPAAAAPAAGKKEESK